MKEDLLKSVYRFPLECSIHRVEVHSQRRKILKRQTLHLDKPVLRLPTHQEMHREFCLLNLFLPNVKEDLVYSNSLNG